MTKIGEDVTKRLDVIPAQWRVLGHAGASSNWPATASRRGRGSAHRTALRHRSHGTRFIAGHPAGRAQGALAAIVAALKPWFEKQLSMISSGSTLAERYASDGRRLA
ncbi:hypothetical protein HU675_0022085 [Bradyrhizobium septentrionale]|nr:hypothetical protein [Bradyrhizobium septentrionale]UGY29178.1 hypothetical protein HU675_0022085 [Bradyrhizobium septentrionale]